MAGERTAGAHGEGAEEPTEEQRTKEDKKTEKGPWDRETFFREEAETRD